jgi:putative restriction endonuclease
MTTGEESENKNLAYYRQRFVDLVVNKSGQSRSILKPILLLSIIDLMAQGIIRENRIYVSDELVKTFEKYWDSLCPSHTRNYYPFFYPFWHLEGDKFWHKTLKSGFNDSNRKKRLKINKKTLREAVEYASLDDELFNILQEPNSRAELIDTLVEVWFSSNRDDLGDILQVNQDLIELAEKEVEISANRPNFDREPRFYLRKSPVRNAFFRKAVVEAYDYRCALCRLKVMRSLTQKIVDGSHIKPFSQFNDDQVNNGISLCKNHHWAFDQGWFAIDDNYRIIVANDLKEESPNARCMKDFHSETILLPTAKDYRPRLESLEWHRLNVFKA